MARPSFLFVDDDPLFGDLMRHFADEAFPGARVVSLTDASAVAGLCARRSFDCVVFDHHMPGVSGFDAAAALRRAFPYLPIVMVTAAGDEMLAVSALKSGINDYIPKARLSAQSMRAVFEHAIETMSLKRIIDARRIDLEREVVDSNYANKVLARANEILQINEAALEALVEQRTAALRDEINTRRVMATAIAHELNQPLAAITNYLSGTVRLAESAEVTVATMAMIADASRRAAGQAVRAGELLRLLRNSITRDDSVMTDEDIGVIAAEAIALASAGGDGLATIFKLDNAAEGIAAKVNRLQIRQVLTNLIQNAVEAVSGSDRCEVETSVYFDPAIGLLNISVADTGPGIPPEQLEEIFMPFVSNKPNRMGIGLSISREIIEQHHGKLTTRPNPEGGAIFSIELPI